MRAIRPPRANSAHHNLFVCGKGDVEREIPIPMATHAALEAWLRAHPQRRGGGLRDDDMLFISLARASNSVPGAISQQGLAKLVRRYAGGVVKEGGTNRQVASVWRPRPRLSFRRFRDRGAMCRRC